jgi:hypothetical protein
MDLDKKYDNYEFPVTAAEPQDGHAGYLSEQQIAQVHQLRMMLEAEGYTQRLDTLTLVGKPANGRLGPLSKRRRQLQNKTFILAHQTDSSPR